MSERELSSVQTATGLCFGQEPTKRFHRTKADSLIFEDKTHDNMNPFFKAGFKPFGLWYGFGKSWINWVRAEMPEWEEEFFQNTFELDLNIEKILTINKDNILSFTEEYRDKDEIRKAIFGLCVDWGRVAEDYHGIESPKYLSDYRLDNRTHWYYSWDCASGCVWNKKAVKSITRLDQ